MRAVQLDEGKYLAMARADFPADFARIFFDLHVGNDWPPVSVETIWGSPTEAVSEFTVASIPFFVPGLALGDVIGTHRDISGTLRGGGVLRDSGHFKVWVITMPEYSTTRLLALLRPLGCGVEVSPFPSLVAIDVTDKWQFNAVCDVLQLAADLGQIEFELSKTPNA